MSVTAPAHASMAPPVAARLRRGLVGAAFLAAGGLAWWWLATHHFGGAGGDSGHATDQPAAAVAPDGVVSLPPETVSADVDVVRVRRVPLRDHVTVPGRVDYDARRQVDYGAPVDGIVSQVNVRVRQRVKAGDPLAELSSRDVGMARNDVRKCMADLEIAAKAADWAATIHRNVEAMLVALEPHPPLDDIDRRFGKEVLGNYRQLILGSYSKFVQAEKVRASTTSLEGGGVLSGRIVEERQSNLEVARENFHAQCEEARFLTRQDRDKSVAEREQAERVLEISLEHLRALVGNSAVDDATGDQPDDDSLSTLVLRSPIDGLVEDIFVARGERVAPGKRMFVVADTSTLWVRAMVHERQWTAVDVADGQTVSVTVPGALVHDATATINHVGATVEAESRSVPLVAELDNDDAHYKPGMFVWVDLPQGALRDAIAVPAEAVMRHDGRTFVFVPEGGGRFRRRDVQTGIETDALIEVTGGLDEGDEVVSRGAFLLKSRLLLEKETEGGSAAARTPPGTARPGGKGRQQTHAGLAASSSRPWRQAKPWMAKCSRHGESGGLVGRSERPGEVTRAAPVLDDFVGSHPIPATPGGPGRHQPTEVGQGEVGRMPSLTVKPENGTSAACIPPGTARPGGPGRHQPTEVGQGEVGRMPSLAVKPEARCSRA